VRHEVLSSKKKKDNCNETRNEQYEFSCPFQICNHHLAGPGHHDAASKRTNMFQIGVSFLA
jgi:hypothetical protein